ncbi:MAG: glycine betaine/L-proline ABC transporter substrate-binding protein ProX, partial [Anaerolineales bacterium]|nr:glycine betaine/L-proline ABC transporter substrate-binding protein ProX [Anaerolineales bacterium]
GYVAQGGALQGYLVDAAGAEEFNIQSLEDFKRPEVQAAYDRDGDGRADMVACPPGWGCELIIEHHLDVYDLRDNINAIKAGYTPAMADAIAAYQAGEHILFYTWTPNWTVDALTPGEEVVWITVPFSSLPEDQKDMEEATTMADVTGCVANPCNLGFPANDIRPVANSAFIADNPAIE